jgi:hypothetical protein
MKTYPVPVLCGACKRMHIVILSHAVQSIDLHIPDRPTRVAEYMAPRDTPLGENADGGKASQETTNEDNHFEIYFNCPEDDAVQILSVIPKNQAKGSEIQVLGLVDQEFIEPSKESKDESIAPIPNIQVLGAALGSDKQIEIIISKKTTDKKILYKITDVSTHANVFIPKEKFDISEKIDYRCKTEPWPRYDYIEFHTYYEGSPENYNVGIILIVVNSMSYSPGPERYQIIEYSKNLITNSINRLREFTNLMVPTVSGIITVHIGLFSFLGIDKIVQNDAWKTLWYVSPIFPLILSLFLFHYAVVPSVKDIRTGNLDSIRTFREPILNSISTKTTYAFMFFSAGLVLLGLVLIPISIPQTAQDLGEKVLVYENPRFEYSVEYPSFWNVSSYNNDRKVILRQIDVPIGPNVQILTGTFEERPKLKEFALEKRSDLGINASTPIPDKLGNVNNAYYITWNNGTTSIFRIVALDDERNAFYLFDYTASKVDYEIYLDTANKIKNSFFARPS